MSININNINKDNKNQSICSELDISIGTSFLGGKGKVRICADNCNDLINLVNECLKSILEKPLKDMKILFSLCWN